MEWRGAVPSMTLNWSPMAPFLVVFCLKMQSDEVEVRGGFCTLCCVAFTDIESMIGDAVLIQRTPRSTPAACSVTRTMDPPFLFGYDLLRPGLLGPSPT